MRWLLFCKCAAPNDHSFGTGELIEVKLGSLCRIFGKASTGQTSAARSDRQQDRAVFWPHRCCRSARKRSFASRRLRCPDAFAKSRAPPASVPVRRRKPASGQKPVKFRMRQIEIPRDLLELRAVRCLGSWFVRRIWRRRPSPNRQEHRRGVTCLFARNPTSWEAPYRISPIQADCDDKRLDPNQADRLVKPPC